METDIKKYFYFEWNATRTNFWMFFLLNFVIGAIIGAAGLIGSAFDIAITLALIIPNIAINKARLNDAGWSGWWMLFPVLNLIVMGFFATKEEDNKYAVTSNVVGQT